MRLDLPWTSSLTHKYTSTKAIPIKIQKHILKDPIHYKLEPPSSTSPSQSPNRLKKLYVTQPQKKY